MSLILPPPRPQFDSENEAQTRRAIEQEDARNVKTSDYATATKRGIVKVDGSSIVADRDGTIHAGSPVVIRRIADERGPRGFPGAKGADGANGTNGSGGGAMGPPGRRGRDGEGIRRFIGGNQGSSLNINRSTILGGWYFSPTAPREAIWITDTNGVGDLFGIGDPVAHYGGGGGSGGGTVIGLTPTATGADWGYSGNAIFLIHRNLCGCWIAGLNSATTLRLLVGFAQNTPISSATPLTQFIGFRYDTNNGDTTWHCISSDGVTTSDVASTVVPSSAVRNYLAVACAADGSAVDYYIDGVYIATISSHLPNTTTGLRGVYEMRLFTTANKTALFGTARMQMDARY